MGRFSDFFENEAENVDILHAYAPSKRFKETVKDCKVLKDFSYEERGIVLKAGERAAICVKYIEKYVAQKVIEELKGEEYQKKINWQLKKIEAQKVKELRKASEKKEKVAKGRFQNEMDVDEYLEKLAIETVVFPDLRDAELQDSYGVRSAVSLLYRMMGNAGEVEALKIKANEINGFDDTIEEMQEEAKN